MFFRKIPEIEPRRSLGDCPEIVFSRQHGRVSSGKEYLFDVEIFLRWRRLCCISTITSPSYRVVGAERHEENYMAFQYTLSAADVSSTVTLSTSCRREEGF